MKLNNKLSLVSLLQQMLAPVIILITLYGSVWITGRPITDKYLILSIITFLTATHIFDQLPFCSSIRQCIIRHGQDLILSWAAVVVIVLFFGQISGFLDRFPSGVLITWFMITPLTLFGSQIIISNLIERYISIKEIVRSAVIVGANDIGQYLANKIDSASCRPDKFMGFFDDRINSRLPEAVRDKIIGKLKDLPDYVRKHKIQSLYLTMPMADHPRTLGLLDELKDTTASIYFVPNLFITDVIQGRVSAVEGIPVISVCETPFSGWNGFVKRCFDICFATLILVLIAPLLAAIAAAIKLTTQGPVIFKQRRYGVDGIEITVYKFRSMTVCENEGEIKQARKSDSRITKIGSFLRKTSLDELPQFFNVLQNTMSIVGPRPHAISHNEKYRRLIKGYMVRHKVKPGITGLAQIKGFRGETEVLDKMEMRIRYDIEYLRNWSLLMDLEIILKSISVIFKHQNAH